MLLSMFLLLLGRCECSAPGQSSGRLLGDASWISARLPPLFGASYDVAVRGLALQKARSIASHWRVVGLSRVLTQIFFRCPCGLVSGRRGLTSWGDSRQEHPVRSPQSTGMHEWLMSQLELCALDVVCVGSGGPALRRAPPDHSGSDSATGLT